MSLPAKTKQRKKTFLLYYDQSQIWDGLSDNQAGKLIKLLHRNLPPSSQIEDPLIKYAYKIIKKKIDDDYDKWIEKCKKNKENAKKRWEEKNMQMNANACDRMETNATYADNDNDNDNDNEF